MIFPKADLDKLVQVADMFRIDASGSFFSEGEVITELNIYPDFIDAPATVFNIYMEDCPEDWRLDWAYETDGDHTVKVEIKTATDTKSVEYTVSAITEADDMLLSSDSMIYSYESELRRFLPEGRNSWKYLHRKAQKEILDYLYRNGILNPDGTKIEKTQLIADKLDLWSTFETMLLIYQDLKVSNAEVFNEKLVDYSEKRADARKRYIISYDSDKDGDVDSDDVPSKTRVTFFSR
jgi:hypothetical protein